LVFGFRCSVFGFVCCFRLLVLFGVFYVGMILLCKRIFLFLEAPFNLNHFNISMESAERYECGDNFFKMDMQFNATLGVPVNAGNIDKLIGHYLIKAGPLPLPFYISMKTGDEPGDASRGHLKTVSPVELRMAVLKAVARDVKAGDMGELRNWRLALLSCRFVYLPIDSDEESWKKARQLREDVSQNHAALRLSALQSIYELVHFKRRHERIHGKCSSKFIADAYRTGITFAETSETVTDSFVDQAMTIDARMLSNDVVSKILLYCDDKFGLQTPFNVRSFKRLCRKLALQRRSYGVSRLSQTCGTTTSALAIP
jgi:hypothetical protein